MFLWIRATINEQGKSSENAKLLRIALTFFSTNIFRSDVSRGDPLLSLRQMRRGYLYPREGTLGTRHLTNKRVPPGALYFDDVVVGRLKSMCDILYASAVRARHCTRLKESTNCPEMERSRLS